MAYLPIALSLIAVFIALYYYCTKDREYFKKHGILCVPPVPLLGNMAGLINKKGTMFEVLKKSYDLHPDAKYVGFFEFTRPLVMIRDLELIKTVTIKHFDHFVDHRAIVNRHTDPLFGGMLFSLTGDQWKEDRTLLSPTFTSSKIKGMFKLMTVCAINFSKHIAKLPEKGRELEMKAMLSMYTNDVIASCVYGVSLDTMADPKNIFYVYGRGSNTFSGFINSMKLLMLRNVPKLARVLGLKLLPQHISDFFLNQVINTIKTRETTGASQPDMIQLWMDSKNKKEDGKVFTPFEIACHAFSFFFGGFDSVSGQASMITHLLAEYPDVQTRLQEEIDEAMEQCNGQLTYEVLNEMKYLDAVVNETLRLYPIVIFLDRMCVKEYQLPPALPGAKPFTVKPGMNIWIPNGVIQKDPNYYDNPDKFDPDRFLNDGKRILNSGAYMPFGVGPRMCIGNRFALTQIKVLVCYLLATCNLKGGSKTKFPLEIEKGMLNITSKNGFWLKIEPRKNLPPSLQVNGVANGVCKNGIGIA